VVQVTDPAGDWRETGILTGQGEMPCARAVTTPFLRWFCRPPWSALWWGCSAVSPSSSCH